MAPAPPPELLGTVRSWGVENLLGQALVASLRNAVSASIEGAWVYAPASSPDSATLATAGGDEMIKLWRGDSAGVVLGIGSLRKTSGLVLGFRGRVENLSEKDVSTNTFSGHTGAVNCVTISPDGKLLASARADRTVIVWDVIQFCAWRRSLS